MSYFRLKLFKKYNMFNTVASQRLVFEEKNELFGLENTSKLTLEFLYNSFSKEIS